MPDVYHVQFRSTAAHDRVIARARNANPLSIDPLKLLIRLEDEALEQYDARLPASQSAFVRAYIHNRLNSMTR